MAGKGLIPIVLGGGLAYWAYKNKDEVAEKEDDDLDPLEELAREAKHEREVAAKAAEAKKKAESGS